MKQTIVAARNVLSWISSPSVVLVLGVTVFFMLVTNVVFSGQKAASQYGGGLTERTQAYYLALGGVEYAQHLKKQGTQIGVVEKTMEPGEFIIEEKNGYLVVTGIVNETESKLSSVAGK
ncbi:MAG: hypothetical protein ACD_62C00282G0002 [uncultured bacterium]|nr:MAG: hypothetical protein ACD_62C00282G0002 [uncultured bacterium]